MALNRGASERPTVHARRLTSHQVYRCRRRFSGGGLSRIRVLREVKDPRVTRVRVLDGLPPDATLRGQFRQQRCRSLIKRAPKLELGQLLARGEAGWRHSYRGALWNGR